MSASAKRSSTPPHVYLLLLFRVIAAFLVLAVTWPALAANFNDVGPEQLARVFPGADSFSEKSGEPPVYRAYREQPGAEPELLGYLFETPDLPPEEVGYSAPIEVLVGMDLRGMITGIEILFYRESYKSIRGDFINSERFPDQFADKTIGEGFRVGRDVDGISRATITSWAVSRGIRNAARRVAEAYMSDSEFVAEQSGEALALAALEAQTWQDMKDSGLVRELDLMYPDQTELRLDFALMAHDGLGAILVSDEDYSRADREASNRAADGYLMLVGIDGDSSMPFRQERLSVRQGDSVFDIPRTRFVYVGSADRGKIEDQVRFAGAMVLPSQIDIAQPFDVRYDAGIDTTTGERLVGLEYQVPPLPLALVQGNELPAEYRPDTDGGYEQYAEPGSFAALVENAPWPEVGALLVLLALVMTSFLRKSATLRWVTLAYTLVYLGWIDGGFVSVSHITNGIKLGPSMFMQDLPLLLIIVFTVVTTLFWGRVLCSSLCPFGALQDFMTRFLPRSWQRTVPQAIHGRAIFIKYGILFFLIAMALIYTELSLFQYFEPFGTAFYFSQSWLLWVILALILAGAAVIPRFYCRYACPLGAALGLGALLSPWRIKRVPQCQVCRVCEHACPTGAIRAHQIDFKECVRCDVCERKLIKQAGTCRHSVPELKSRLKTWEPIATG